MAHQANFLLVSGKPGQESVFGRNWRWPSLLAGGPTADTGGLMLNHAPTIYAYRDVPALLEAEARGGEKAPLPARGEKPLTERP